jgi:heptosyltransferase-1
MKIREDPTILIMHRGGGLGDLLVSTCVTRALRERWPGARIAFLCSEPGRELLADSPSVDDVIVAPTGVRTPWELAALIRPGHFDIAICLWSAWLDAWAASLAGIPIRIGQGSKLLYSRLYTHRVDVRSERGDTESHWGEIMLDYIRPLGIDPAPPRPDYRLAQPAAAAANDEIMIGFHIGKGLPLDGSKWPCDAFLSMARALVEAVPCRLLLTGSASEAPLVGVIAGGLGDRALDVSGRTSIAELAGLISRCAAFVCPDSFPMHLAAVLNVPTVGIFALKSDFPKRWGPLCTDFRIVRPRKWRCTKRCVKETCQDFECYRDVDPGDVVSAVLDLLPESVRRRD